MQRLDLASRRLVHPAARLAAQSQDLATLARRLKRASDTQQLRRESGFAVHGRHFASLLRAPLPQTMRVARSGELLRRAASAALAGLSQRVASLAAGLKHLNPQGVLDRGYSIVTTAAGAIVQDAAQLAIGDAVDLRFARGGADAEVITRKLD